MFRKKKRYTQMSKLRNSYRIALNPCGAMGYQPPERKCIDTTFSSAMPATGTGDVIPINLVSLGDDYDKRDGRQTVNETIQVEMTFDLPDDESDIGTHAD